MYYSHIQHSILVHMYIVNLSVSLRTRQEKIKEKSILKALTLKYIVWYKFCLYQYISLNLFNAIAFINVKAMQKILFKSFAYFNT